MIADRITIAIGVFLAIGLTIHGLVPGTATAQPSSLAMVGQDDESVQARTRPRQATQRTGNVIFIHPDGSGLNAWNAARMYWAGPDARLEWDRLPKMAVYRGHMADRLTGTSNGGATVHAFGYKVQGNGSYGKDGGGEGETGRDILSLSGYAGSILREAANAGHPVGVINDGDAAEPGTGAFLAEVDDRDESHEIVRQILHGRPGYENEARPVVVLAGGERFFLPLDTPACIDEVHVDCYVHLDPINGRGPARADDRNLIEEAIDAGYEVIRTRAEFEVLLGELEADETYAPMVLGLFAADDIFNDKPEEVLIDLGLIDESADPSGREGNLIIWGGVPGTLSHDPPKPDEMMEMALIILDRHSKAMEKPFFLVAEVESTDNLPNNTNSIGTLRALQYADRLIGVARDFQAHQRRTLVLTAADSDAGGLQLFSPPPVDEAGNVTVSGGHPTGSKDDEGFPLDGILGHSTPPFVAAPDAFGNEFEFAVGYTGDDDVAGAILSRAQGMNAGLLGSFFSAQYDSTDLYRLIYLTLFGEMLPAPQGVAAPDRFTD